MADKNPWKVSALISACFEFLLAIFIILQMVFVFLTLQLMKHFSVGRTCSYTAHRLYALFPGGHFHPFSVCGECAGGRTLETGAGRPPARLSSCNFVLNYPKNADQREINPSSRAISGDCCAPSSINCPNCEVFLREKQCPAFLLGKAHSEDLPTSRELTECECPSVKTDLPVQGRSAGTTLVYRRKEKQNNAGNVMKSEGILTKKLGQVKIEDGLFSLKEEASTPLFNEHFGPGHGVDREMYRWLAAELQQNHDGIDERDLDFFKHGEGGNEDMILILMKLLQAERRNLRTLYEELEEERIAAETAANEAMAMILRLQEEKSALHMESAHYQRMAEEKAIHYEQAIQFLEEDLCRKESEWLHLEEELNLLRTRSFGDVTNVNEAAEGMEEASLCSEVGKPIFLLKGSDDVSYPEEQQEIESVDLKPPDVKQKCDSINIVNPMKSFETNPTEDQPLKRFKGFVLHENENSESTLSASGVSSLCHVSDSALIGSLEHPEKLQLSSDEDDASSILIQLLALEKQLQALGEPEALEPWNLAQASQDYLASDFLKSNSSGLIPSHEKDEDAEMLKQGGNSRVLESYSNLTDSNGFNIFEEEERVVNIDVANMNYRPCREAQIATAEGILEIQGENQARSKSLQCEAREDEKHLDLPSFVPSSNPDPDTTRSVKETCKPDVQSLQDPSPNTVLVCEEDNWNSKRVTLEDINSRLQVLENESVLLRHHSVPSNREHISLVLLREVLQELQELLKANRNPFVLNGASPSVDSCLKGGQLRKRHYSDGPGSFDNQSMQWVWSHEPRRA